MKKNLIALALAALPFVATAAPILIDFDSSPVGAIASGTVITSQYASLGVTFSALEDGNTVSTWAATQFAASTAGAGHAGNSLWNCNVGCGPRADIIRINFAAPVNGVSWSVDSEGGLPITFNAYSATNVLLQSVQVTSTWPNFAPASFSVSGIARIDALQPSDTWGWSMDNLQFTSGSTVPEPGSLALAGLTLAAAGLVRRRREAASR